MKKTLPILLAVCLVLSLSACGSDTAPQSDIDRALPQADTPVAADPPAAPPEPEPLTDPDAASAPMMPPERDPRSDPVPLPDDGAAPVDGPDEAPQPPAPPAPDSTEPITEPAPEPTLAPEPIEPLDLKAVACQYIGSSVYALYAAIGYPASSDYAPSCLGDGEDGNLYYNGFVVYTYREGDSEEITYVE